VPEALVDYQIAGQVGRRGGRAGEQIRRQLVVGPDGSDRCERATWRRGRVGWEIAGRYQQFVHSALRRPPVAVWREHEDSTPLRMPADRLCFSCVSNRRQNLPLRLAWCMDRAVVLRRWVT